MNNKKEFIVTSYTSWVIQSILYSSKPCRSALRYTEPLTQRTTASAGNKATGCETDNSTAPIVEVKDGLSSNSNPPVDIQGVEKDKLTILIASEN
jgi:hypothetical protein